MANSYEWNGIITGLKLYDTKWGGKVAWFRLCNDENGKVDCSCANMKLIPHLRDGMMLAPTNYKPNAWSKKNEQTNEWKNGFRMNIVWGELDEIGAMPPSEQKKEPNVVYDCHNSYGTPKTYSSSDLNKPPLETVDWDDDQDVESLPK